MVAFLSTPIQGFSASKREKMGTIYLVPVGEAEQAVLTYLSKQLEQIFPFSVKIVRLSLILIMPTIKEGINTSLTSF